MPPHRRSWMAGDESGRRGVDARGVAVTGMWLGSRCDTVRDRTCDQSNLRDGGAWLTQHAAAWEHART